MDEVIAGKAPMKKYLQLLYLGFMLSHDGGNMQNILLRRNKAL